MKGIFGRPWKALTKCKNVKKHCFYVVKWAIFEGSHIKKLQVVAANSY
jgi:hypothetical protein